MTEIENAFTSMSAEEFSKCYGFMRPAPTEGNEERLIVHCGVGKRAVIAVAFLRSLGFQKLVPAPLPLMHSFRRSMLLIMENNQLLDY